MPGLRSSLEAVKKQKKEGGGPYCQLHVTGKVGAGRHDN